MTDEATRQVVMTHWMIFRSPLDFPGQIVVRPFDVVHGHSEPIPRKEFWLCGSLEEARELIRRGDPGLVCLQRNPGDHESVVEVWI